MQSLTLAQASTIVDVALKTGRDKKFQPLSVAVLDPGGHLVAFKREDKSGILRFDIAFGKAWGALGMGFGSRTLFERAANTPQFFTALAAASGGKLVPNPGGVLIRDSNGDIIGATGISGDTSAGGLSRVDLALEGDVRVMLVAMGGNDALRALPVGDLKRNLARIIERARARQVRVVLAGMEAPPNFGRDYAVSFHQVYRELAKEYGVPLVPFLLDGVAGVEGLNQRDGIHPTADGARVVADHVWTVLEPVVREAAKGPASQ